MNKILQQIELTERRQKLQAQLGDLLWGSIEVRSKGDSRKVYLHRRQAGVNRTIYAGNKE